MCKVIDSELILKSYFKKHPRRIIITYQQLMEIRDKAEPKLDNVYLDISYSSLRDAMCSNPNSICIEQKGIRVINSDFLKKDIIDADVYQVLSNYL